ncbi:MAG: zf-HC2 domain-containing protein [Deltaproteobacteria bacterium]|nr:zf-HC2 domain-containing protein [Deltaproteobacteria bacterium]
MLSCFGYRKRLGAYLDDELKSRRRRAVSAHLAKCPACRAALAEMRGLESALLSLDAPAPPSNLTSRIMAEASSRYRRADVRPEIDRPRYKPSLPWTWAFRAATVAALIVGLATGAFLGWDVGREDRVFFADPSKAQTTRMQRDVYGLDAFSGTPDGSIEAATLALLQDAK